MLFYCSDRDFRQYEGGAPQLTRTDAAKGLPCKAVQARLESIGLIAHTAFKRCGPIALHEIVAAVEQQHPRIIQILADPGRCVQRSTESIAGFDGRNEPLLIGKDSRQPQFAEQRVTRCETIVERALRSLQE